MADGRKHEVRHIKSPQTKGSRKVHTLRLLLLPCRNEAFFLDRILSSSWNFGERTPANHVDRTKLDGRTRRGIEKGSHNGGLKELLYVRYGLVCYRIETRWETGENSLAIDNRRKYFSAQDTHNYVVSTDISWKDKFPSRIQHESELHVRSVDFSRTCERSSDNFLHELTMLWKSSFAITEHSYRSSFW